jgi:hypothetical protein
MAVMAGCLASIHDGPAYSNVSNARRNASSLVISLSAKALGTSQVAVAASSLKVESIQTFSRWPERLILKTI